ncbi:MAG TPA: sugar phosphate isomerase/epimerase [Tepidisphaeraceae bacterium]|nr:sugar phosphate isomerase/epimerase [Tepidisphaeraceae bacterium]
MHQTTRRNFLRSTAALTAGALAAPSLFAADVPPANKPKPRIGVQLYSVRNELKTDFDGTIEKLGKIGFAGVEFASLMERQRKPKDLRKLLDDNGLKTCGTHTPLQTLTGDALKVTIDLHKELGNTFLIAPSLPAKTIEQWQEMAKRFADIAAKCKEHGMFTGYHAHAGDFKLKDETGRTSWELFFDTTSPDVIHQIDTGNTLDGGGDPLAMIKKYAGRTKSSHVKEHGVKDAPVGGGKVDWKTYLDAYESVGGIEWYVVEYEQADPLAKLKTSLENLKKLGR